MLDPLQFKQPIRLDVGAGGFSSDPSFTSVDKYTEADIVADMWDIPLPNESVDWIYCNNALEHVSKFDVVPTLREWWRLLRPGGLLQLIVPDLEWTLRFWLEVPTTGWPMDIIYGNQNHAGEFHRTGFTPKILWNYFVEANPGGWHVNEMKLEHGEYEKRENKEEESVTYIDAFQRLIIVNASKVSI